MKKAIKLIFGLIFIFMVTACGGNNETSNGAENNNNNNQGNANVSNDQEEITLRIAWWGSQPRHDLTLEVIKMFEEQNPTIKIDPEYASWDDYWQRLAPQAAANQLPDIIQMDLSRISQYAENGQLADLNSFIGNQIDVANIADTVVSGGKIGEKLYGFNLGVNAIGFHYNPALLKEIGIEELPENWTWNDYIDMSQKAVDAGIYFDTALKADVFFNYYLRTQGKSLYGADGKLGYEDDQLFVDFFTMAVNQVNKGATPSPDFLAQLSGLEDDPVVKQEGIGVWQWSNQFVNLQQVAGVPFKIHPMPGPNAKEGLFLKPSMYFSVSENSKHKEAAAKFISFWVNDVEANKLIKGDRGVPVSSVVKDALLTEVSEAQAQIFEYIDWAEQNSSDLGPLDPANAGQIIELLDSIEEQMKYGMITPEQAASTFRTQAQSILN